MDAYDYDNQKWVSGKEGAAVMAKQIREAIAIYEGPDAEKFLRFNASKSIVAEELESLRDALVEADAEVNFK